MAAMKTVVQASDKGGGMHEATGSLGSGGTWQVTIAAVQNGQTILNNVLQVRVLPVSPLVLAASGSLALA
jgi:hypothetical protein